MNRTNLLSFERLENRCMMAGNVAAQLQGGNLVLIGDAADNQVVLNQVAANSWQISGKTATTINGQSSAVINGVTNILTHFREGNNTVQVSGSLAGNVMLTAGGGNDLFMVTNFATQGSILVSTGNGTNYVSARNVTVGGANGYKVTGGEGNDTAVADNLVTTHRNAENMFYLEEGRDVIQVTRSTIGGHLVISTEGEAEVSVSQVDVQGNLVSFFENGNHNALSLFDVRIGNYAVLYGADGDGDTLVRHNVTSAAGWGGGFETVIG